MSLNVSPLDIMPFSQSFTVVKQQFKQTAMSAAVICSLRSGISLCLVYQNRPIRDPSIDPETFPVLRTWCGADSSCGTFSSGEPVRPNRGTYPNWRNELPLRLSMLKCARKRCLNTANDWKKGTKSKRVTLKFIACNLRVCFGWISLTINTKLLSKCCENLFNLLE